MMGPKGRGSALKIPTVLWNGVRLSGKTFRRFKKLWHTMLRRRGKEECRAAE